MKWIIAFMNLFLLSIFVMLPCRSTGAEDYFEQGLVFLQAQKYDQAIEAFSRTLEIIPHDFEAYNNRGIAWLYKGDSDRAIDDFTKSLDINPGYFQAYNNRGGAWVYKGDYDRAVDDFTQALTINPYDYEAYNNRGGAWFYNKDYKRAIADYKKSLEINAACDAAYNQLSRIYSVCPDVKYRDSAKAVDLAEKAVELQKRADYLDTLATAYAEAGRYEDAITTQESAISMLNKEGASAELNSYVKRLNSYKTHKPLQIASEKVSKLNEPTPKTADNREKERSQPENDKAQVSSAKPPEEDRVSSKKVFSIQVGAFLSRKNAEKLIVQLKEKGYVARLYITSDASGIVWFKVLIGEYTTRQNAQDAAVAFSAKETLSSVVYQIDEL